MASTTIKVSVTTRDRIRALGEIAQQTADGVVAAALDALERDQFWTAYDKGVELVAGDLDAVAADRAEQGDWDVTLSDRADA
jgi:predicted transcriptional regulator